MWYNNKAVGREHIRIIDTKVTAMRLRENFYYDNVLDYKYNIIKLLYGHDDDETYQISARDLLSLYLIDYENAGAEEYDPDSFAFISGLYDTYSEDRYRSLSVTVKELRHILELGKTNRVSLEFNKKIAAIFLDLFLKTHSNPYYKITHEQFEDICDHLLEE